MCQSCVDNGYLSQATYDQLTAFVARWPESEYGPAHIVLSDANVLDSNLAFARARVVTMLADVQCVSSSDARAELTATLALLDELAVIPEDER